MFRISVEQFAMLEGSVSQEKVVTNAKIASLDFDLSKRNVRVRYEFSFFQDEKKVMLLNVSCEFNVHEDDWKEIEKENTCVFPKYFIDHLFAQSVGTARGILHCKTEGTRFNSIIIPPLNVTTALKEDVVVNKPVSE